MNKPLHLNIPISKIDEEQRMVWGYATVEEIDKHGDIIGYDASVKAFGEWVGNIREMHDAVAIGKKVEVQNDDVNKGVWLGAYISESADGENAWTKVKEGILQGFSIGGTVKDFKMVKDSDDEMHMMVTDYDLNEVSLVDNPACPSAMLQVVKSVKGGGLQRVETLQKGTGRTPAWWETAFHYSPSQAIKKTVMSYNKSMKSDIQKDIYSAAYLVNLGRDLAWVVYDKKWQGEDATDLETALESIKQASITELKEGERWPDDTVEVFELAAKAVNLSKGTDMEKTVTGAEDRDHKAEVVLSQEETGRPVNDTKERSEDAGVAPAGSVVENEDGDKEVQPLVHADTSEAEKPAEDAVTVNDEEVETKDEAPKKGKKEVEPKSAPVDFTKSMSVMSETLTKVADLVGKVAEGQSQLAGRIDALEGKPAASKVAKGTFVDVTKAEEAEVSAEETHLQSLLKQADELAADPSKGDITVRTKLATDIRKAQRAMDPASVQKAAEIRAGFQQ